MPPGMGPWWSRSLAELGATPILIRTGLADDEARRRLARHGPNELREYRSLTRWQTLWNQVKSPLMLLLVFALAASVATGEWVDACIVGLIVIASTTVGASREYRAQSAAEALRARVQARASVLRGGRELNIPAREVVSGDLLLLSAGSLVPADGAVVEANHCFVNEAVLTGESFPVEKKPGLAAATASLAERLGCVFQGTNVVSGTARVFVVKTGTATEFGAIADRLNLDPPETEFDRGIRRFGTLLTSAMLVMIVLVFAANMLLHRSVGETLLFAIALAVGLSPELLPAILSVNLARGAQRMGSRGVLVRHLNAIENLGSMDILCTDKTGTLTEGVIRLEGAFDPQGQSSATVLALASTNAALQSGLENPLDEAINAAHQPDLLHIEKIADIPYDFVRKRLSVVVRGPDGVRVITKGAFARVLAGCSRTTGGAPLDAATRDALEQRFQAWSAQGTRVIALASRSIEDKPSYDRDDEQDLEFAGFLTFLDRPKAGVREAIAELERLGVSIKLITGDVEPVARHLARRVGLRGDQVLTGKALDELHDEALWHAAEKTQLFVEVDPNQKERIILSLKKLGHVVGFMGDGINDAPAMHAADTSLSVEEAVDVAREAADFVLLEQHLDVIRQGIEEGRRTFANTLKYVLTTTSANLGNMVSMAVASLFLPFLPLTAGQILLNNFLSDIPAIGIASDSVDHEMVEQPRRWDMRFVARFMVEFGLVSSLFDFLTFGVLLYVFQAGPELFRTGWFVESLLTELVIALVVRTRRPFFRSRPGRFLLSSSLILIVLSFAIPYAPFAGVLGFVPLPPLAALALAGITALYVLVTEVLKSHIFRNGG